MTEVPYFKPPCPPTVEALLAHYQRCADACLHPANRAIFEEEMRLLREKQN